MSRLVLRSGRCLFRHSFDYFKKISGTEVHILNATNLPGVEFAATTIAQQFQEANDCPDVIGEIVAKSPDPIPVLHLRLF
jgi:hypothetical protein